MPEKYTVKITTQAQEQLKEIIHYINYSLQAPGTAMKMLDTLEKEIASLDQFPNRVPLTAEEPWHSQGIHKLPVKNYLVYFWVDEEAKKGSSYRHHLWPQRSAAPAFQFGYELTATLWAFVPGAYSFLLVGVHYHCRSCFKSLSTRIKATATVVAVLSHWVHLVGFFCYGPAKNEVCRG